MKLEKQFYIEGDVVEISKKLLGCSLFTNVGNQLTGGTIIETEAYRGPEDRASHAYLGRRTKRTEVMFHEGGVCYVYLCYGIHFLLNVVTGKEEIPHAVLIRAIVPHTGIPYMLERRKKIIHDKQLTSGPGSICQALGIDQNFNGLSFQGDLIWIESGAKPTSIVSSPRIGIDYAGCDAHLPWRFCVR